MKNLKNTLLTLTLIALSSTGLVGMNEAPDFQMLQDGTNIGAVDNQAFMVKSAFDAELACWQGVLYCNSLKNLLKIYSVDALVVPLEDYLKNKPEFLLKLHCSGGTVLHHAMFGNNNGAVIELLVKAAGQRAPEFVCMKDSRGCTALHYAVIHYTPVEVKLLLDAAGKKVLELVGVQANGGDTAMNCAIKNKKKATIELLEKYQIRFREIV